MGCDELLSCFADLHSAVHERNALERRLRDMPGLRADDVIREQSLAACETVLVRRAALYRCLIRQGWTPPAAVVRDLLSDEVLLDEPLGSAGG
jgi:hypothetical protein